MQLNNTKTDPVSHAAKRKRMSLLLGGRPQFHQDGIKHLLHQLKHINKDITGKNQLLDPINDIEKIMVEFN